MFNTTTKKVSIARPTTTPFRWGQDFNQWVPLMLHCSLQSHRKNCPMFSLRPTNPPSSLNGFNTSAKRLMTFCINPMLSTRSAMINIGCHTCFKWETRYGCMCRKSALHGPIRRFVHFTMDLTLSPRIWVTMILS
jgi:hypothetical protein